MLGLGAVVDYGGHPLASQTAEVLIDSTAEGAGAAIGGVLEGVRAAPGQPAKGVTGPLSRTSPNAQVGFHQPSQEALHLDGAA